MPSEGTPVTSDPRMMNHTSPASCRWICRVMLSPQRTNTSTAVAVVVLLLLLLGKPWYSLLTVVPTRRNTSSSNKKMSADTSSSAQSSSILSDKVQRALNVALYASVSPARRAGREAALDVVGGSPDRSTLPTEGLQAIRWGGSGHLVVVHIFRPVGTSENSPAVHCWEKENTTDYPSPVGTADFAKSAPLA